MVIQNTGNKDMMTKWGRHSIGNIKNSNKRLEDYETLKPMMEEVKCLKEYKILNLGCGNSEFCERMYDDGYQNLLNIDICENVIKFMQERNKHRENMICILIITKLI